MGEMAIPQDHAFAPRQGGVDMFASLERRGNGTGERRRRGNDSEVAQELGLGDFPDNPCSGAVWQSRARGPRDACADRVWPRPLHPGN